jgi:hypothetical protein
MPPSETSKAVGGARKRRRLPRKMPDSVEIGPLPMMVRGEYFIGGLYSVLSENAWKEFCVLSHAKGNRYGAEGQFTLSNGRVLVIFHLPNGDGIYPDQKGRTYNIDNGTIGLTLVEGLKTEYDDIDKKEDWDSNLKMSGNIVDYKKDFVCMSTTAVHPEIGPVSIIMFGEDVLINSADEVSGVGIFLHQGMASAAKEAVTQATPHRV